MKMFGIANHKESDLIVGPFQTMEDATMAMKVITDEVATKYNIIVQMQIMEFDSSALSNDSNQITTISPEDKRTIRIQAITSLLPIEKARELIDKED